MLIYPDVPMWQKTKTAAGWQKLCCNKKLSLESYTEWATQHIKHTDKWIKTYLTCKLQGKNGDLPFSSLHTHCECWQLWLHTVTTLGTGVKAFNLSSRSISTYNKFILTCWVLNVASVLGVCKIGTYCGKHSTVPNCSHTIIVTSTFATNIHEHQM